MSPFPLYLSKKTHNLSGTLDSLAFLDQTIGTEKYDTDLSSFEVHAHALDTGSEPVCLISSIILSVSICNLLDELLGLDIAHSVDTGDTVAVIDTSQPLITSS